MHVYRVSRGNVIAWRQASSSLVGTMRPRRAGSTVTRGRERAREWFIQGALGTAAITGAGDIASAEVFGTATLTTPASVTGAGDIASAEAFDTPAVSTPGHASVASAGDIASAEAFGTAIVTSDLPIVLAVPTPGYIVRAVVKGGKRMSEVLTNPGFSAKDPTEDVVVGFDFSALTATILSPVVGATHHSGEADSDPTAVLAGVPTAINALVLQMIVGGIDRASYELRAEGDTEAGEHLVLSGVLPVRTA